MPAIVIKSASPEDTYACGQKLASYLIPGDVVCLSGDLGQGKTLFTKGVAAALKTDELVTSPTFSLLNIYTGEYGGDSLSIYHFDLYRLDCDEQLTDIGFNEYIFSGGISVIEWPDKFLNSLPDQYLGVEITPGDAPEQRRISLSPHGDRYEKLCGELKL